MTIYTRQGDKGFTHVIGGVKLPKDHPLLNAIGEIDELNAYLGLARSSCSDKDISNILKEIQTDLLRISAELAFLYSPTIARKTNPISKEDVDRIELYIDEYESRLPPLNKFLILGGSYSGALLHIIRTVCRRAERAVVTLFREENVEKHEFILAYLNRISDLFFVLARYINLEEGVREEYWEV